MKVNEEFEDRMGRTPLVFQGYKNLQEVYDWLWQHYQGYHFTIILDITKDEYESYPKELYVYFSDEALGEIAAYADCEVKKK